MNFLLPKVNHNTPYLHSGIHYHYAYILLFSRTLLHLYILGTNSAKTFTVIGSSYQGGEMKKDFDSTVKANVFYLEGHKIILPAVQSNNSS